jgi:hypothetical protein
MARILDRPRAMKSFTRSSLSLSLACTALFACITFAPAAARAAEGNEPKKAEDPTAGLKGFELMVRPSFGGAPSDSPVRLEPDAGVQVQGDPGQLLKGASPWGPGFVGQALVGYRFLPFLSAGLRGGIRTSSASNVGDGSQNLSRTGWDAGIYVRAYPLAGVTSVSKYIDPWFGTGVTYMRDTQSFQRSIPAGNGSNVNADIELDHHAIAVPLALGIDYRVTSFLSLGPSFEYTLANAAAACVKTSAPGFAASSVCSNEAPGSSYIKAKSYGLWTAGLDAKVTF